MASDLERGKRAAWMTAPRATPSNACARGGGKKVDIWGASMGRFLRVQRSSVFAPILRGFVAPASVREESVMNSKGGYGLKLLQAGTHVCWLHATSCMLACYLTA